MLRVVSMHLDLVINEILNLQNRSTTRTRFVLNRISELRYDRIGDD